MSFRATSHLFLWAVSWGGIGYYSYVASPIAFKSLDRDSFSLLQAKVFPQFFLTQSIAPILLGVTAPYALTTGSLVTLALGSIGGLGNALWLGPKTKDIKAQRKLLESQGETESEQYKQLTKDFGKWHGISLLFNLLYVGSLTVYGVILSRNLIRVPVIPK
ncbi:hypothetical protein WICMUC_001170 [Wickerhamomyces mucosus]|uniref:TMEM205-like domain-containing protein n=1 Tax=Wickerhamomyces mucosus TaxID=1378264 RepID=A0A9P8THN3_9ASCO|nr:hypothetical protein WICMUC_001170 [Wickerhamomyces mucosus]